MTNYSIQKILVAKESRINSIYDMILPSRILVTELKARQGSPPSTKYSSN